MHKLHSIATINLVANTLFLAYIATVEYVARYSYYLIIS